MPSTTQPFSFSLTDGNTGSGSFTIPLDQVDLSQSWQTIAIGDLQMTLAGHTFDQSNGDFSGNPVTADFSNGVYSGLTFDVAATAIPVGYQYTAMSAYATDVTVTAIGGQLFNANSAATSPANVTFDFSTVPPGSTQQYSIRVNVETINQLNTLSFFINVGPATTQADIINSFKAALTQAGYYVDVNGTMVTVGGVTAGANASGLKSIDMVFYTATDVNEIPIPNNTIGTPVLVAVVNNGPGANLSQSVTVVINGENTTLIAVAPPPRPVILPPPGEEEEE